MTKSRKTSSRRSQQIPKSGISPMIIGAVVVGALLIVGGLIYLGNLYNNRGGPPPDLSSFPTIGEANAPVTMVEYSDFGCPHCRDFVLDKFEQIKSDYVDSGQLKYVVHPYYLGNPQIGLAAEAAWCAHDQNGFFDYQHALFERQGQLEYTRAALAELGAEIGLDGETLAQCLSDGTHRQDIENARQDATRRGISSTPTFFVNNQRIEGNVPLSQFETVINQEVALAQ